MDPESRLNTALTLVASALREIEACQRELSAQAKKRATVAKAEPGLEREYTISEFCRVEGISRSTLFQWWKEGRGPERRVYGPRRIKIAESDMRSWRHKSSTCGNPGH